MSRLMETSMLQMEVPELNTDFIVVNILATVGVIIVFYFNKFQSVLSRNKRMKLRQESFALNHFNQW